MSNQRKAREKVINAVGHLSETAMRLETEKNQGLHHSRPEDTLVVVAAEKAKELSSGLTATDKTDKTDKTPTKKPPAPKATTAPEATTGTDEAPKKPRFSRARKPTKGATADA